ncbi:MAG: hypothetical protein Q8M33_11780, partial [Hydrogenophaga sp.]|nr:hypothetical protein [Hydrogenophaga sp.]
MSIVAAALLVFPDKIATSDWDKVALATFGPASGGYKKHQKQALPQNNGKQGHLSAAPNGA